MSKLATNWLVLLRPKCMGKNLKLEQCALHIFQGWLGLEGQTVYEMFLYKNKIHPYGKHYFHMRKNILLFGHLCNMDHSASKCNCWLNVLVLHNVNHWEILLDRLRLHSNLYISTKVASYTKSDSSCVHLKKSEKKSRFFERFFKIFF